MGVSAYDENINISRCQSQNVIDTWINIFWVTFMYAIVFRWKSNTLKTVFRCLNCLWILFVHTTHIFITFTAYARYYCLYFVFAKYSLLYFVIPCHEWECIQIVPFCLHFVYSFIDCQLKRTFNNIHIIHINHFMLRLRDKVKNCISYLWRFSLLFFLV